MIDRIILFSAGISHWVDPVKIVYIHAHGAYTNIHMTDGTQLTVSKNLKYIMGLLTRHPFIHKVHRSWAVNAFHIKAVKAIRNGSSATHSLILDNGISFPVMLKEIKLLMETHTICE